MKETYNSKTVGEHWDVSSNRVPSFLPVLGSFFSLDLVLSVSWRVSVVNILLYSRLIGPERPGKLAIESEFPSNPNLPTALDSAQPIPS